MFASKANYTKLRTNLRLAINRLKLLEKKKTELALKARREIADYIAAGKEDRARIRVEHIVREDYLVEAMEIIEMLCDLLLARFGLIEKMIELDPGIEEAVATIIWVTPRLSGDIQELVEVTKQLSIKYSKEYAEMCRRNAFEKVNEKVMHKMDLAAPPKILVENYMIEIAKSYKVPFEPDPAVMMGEPPAVNNLIDLNNIDTMPANQLSCPTNQPSNLSASGSTSTIGAAGPIYSNAENLSAAERKRIEAMGNNNDTKRPPSPPNYGGGGGGGMSVPATSFATPISGNPSSQMGHSTYPTPSQGQFPAGQGSLPQGGAMPPPLPNRPPNSNHNSPEGAYENIGGPVRGHMEPSWSMLDDEEDENRLPSLPPYDTVMKSPGIYPSAQGGPSGNSSNQANPLGPNQSNLGPSGPAQGGLGPVAAPRTSPRMPQRQLGVSTLPDVPGLPSVPTNSVGQGDANDDVNFDDLTRRFEELKKRK